jgi:uncharacterized protein YkwD
LRPVIVLAVVSGLLLAAFLLLRPTLGELGRPTPPDTSGRARRRAPDGVAPSGAPEPGHTPAEAAPSPDASRPDLSDISHPEELEARILELTNEERRKHGRPPLQTDEALRGVARGHSDDMIARNFFDHLNPDGLAPQDRIAVRHRRLIGLTGENIWAESGASPPDLDAVAREMMYGEHGWMNSPPHRANILRPEYTHLGVGIAVKGGELRATQNFALVEALTDDDIPAQVGVGASLNLASKPLNSGPGADRYDYWSPSRGMNTGESYPVTDGMVRAAAGVYRLRFYFPRGGEGYAIYEGPQIEVR